MMHPPRSPQSQRFASPSTRARRRNTALLIVGALAVSGCNVVLGLDDFQPGTSGTGGSTGTSSSSSTGGGGSASCTDGDTEVCYDADAGTPNVGQCRSGTRSCKGGSFGPCEGAVGPSPEDCATTGDEDCDGIACSDVVWNNLYGDVGKELLTGLAADSKGNIYLTGTFRQLITFGSDVLNAKGQQDIFLVKLAPDGKALWSKSFGSAGVGAQSRALAVDTTDNVVIGGHFNGTVDFGKGDLTASASGDLFVAAFDPDGKPLFSTHYDTTNAPSKELTGLAFTTMGDIVLVGNFSGKINFGPGDLDAGQSDFFVVELQKNSGTTLWAKRFGEKNPAVNPKNQLVAAVALSATDEIYVTGSFDGDISLGNENPISAGGGDIFVAKLDAAGNPEWAKGFGDSAAQTASDITVDASGKVLITGVIAGSTTFGGPTLSTSGPGDQNVFVAELSPNGLTIFSKQWGDEQIQGGFSITTDADRNILLSGGLFGTVNFGGADLTNIGVVNGFVAKLDPSGKHLWSKHFGAADTIFSSLVATDPTSRDVLLGLTLRDSVSFGKGSLSSHPTAGDETDFVVAKFSP
jgi:hypothetical protein